MSAGFGVLSQGISDTSNMLFSGLNTYAQHKYNEIYKDWDIENQQRQYRWDRDEAQKQRDWQQKMMEYQNWWNSPEQMMQRYKNAGLNPRLMYGSNANQIASASPQGGAKASPSGSRGMHSAKFNAANIGGQGAMAYAALANITADRKLKEANANKAQSEADQRNIENEYKGEKLGYENVYWRNQAKQSMVKTDIMVQTKIVTINKAYDELTELDRKIRLLEQQARTHRVTQQLKDMEFRVKKIDYQLMKDGIFPNADWKAKFMYQNSDHIDSAISSISQWVPDPLLALMGVMMALKSPRRFKRWYIPKTKKGYNYNAVPKYIRDRTSGYKLKGRGFSPNVNFLQGGSLHNKQW